MKLKNKGWFLFLLIVGLIALNQLVFMYVFNASYLVWYLMNGSLISAVFALLSLTWDTNKNTGLVSANPRHYVGAVQQLIGAQYIAFGALGKRENRKSPKGLERVPLLDALVFIVFALLLLLVNVLWLTMVVPIQYFFVVFLGGPARYYQSSSVKVIAKFEGSSLRYQQIPKVDEVPKDWMDLTIANKSVSLTYGIVALVLAVVRNFL